MSAIRRKKDNPRSRVVYYDGRNQQVDGPPAVVEELKCPICELHNHLRDYCRYYKKWDTESKIVKNQDVCICHSCFCGSMCCFAYKDCKTCKIPISRCKNYKKDERWHERSRTESQDE